MNFAIDIKQYDNNCIYFCEPIKNNIMNDGYFIRILYTSPYVTLNGIYIMINLNEISCEKYYNKYKCSFDINDNSYTINRLKNIEENLLNKINIKKIPQYKIYEQRTIKLRILFVYTKFFEWSFDKGTLGCQSYA